MQECNAISTGSEAQLLQKMSSETVDVWMNSTPFGNDRHGRFLAYYG